MKSWSTFSMAIVLVPTMAVLLLAPAAGAVTLVRNGRAVARILVPKESQPGEERAAREFQRYIRKMSGAELEMASEVTDGPVVSIGNTELARKLGLKLPAPWKGCPSFAVVADENALVLYGRNDRGTLFAVYDFLEKGLGCMFCAPGPLGEVVPKKTTIKIGPRKRISKPFFMCRNIWVGPDWGAKLRLTNTRRPEYGAIEMHGSAGGHAYSRLVPPQRYFNDHPEYFSFRKLTGKRDTRQLCTSNKDVVRIAAESVIRRHDKTGAEWIAVGPNDNHHSCECDACNALDPPGAPDKIDRVLRFANDVAAIVEKQRPDVKIGFYAYANHQYAPLRERPRKNVWVLFTSNGVIRRSILRPLSAAMNRALDVEYEKWKTITPRLGIRHYGNSLQDELAPMPQIRAYAEDIPRYARDGLTYGVINETHFGAEANSLYYYLFGQLMWDPFQDADRIVRRYCERYYGPAAEEMYDYYMAAEDIISAPGRFGTWNTGIGLLLPPESVKKLEPCFGAAYKAAGDNETVMRRIRMAEAGLFRARLADYFSLTWEVKPGEGVLLKGEQHEGGEDLERMSALVKDKGYGEGYQQKRAKQFVLGSGRGRTGQLTTLERLPRKLVPASTTPRGTGNHAFAIRGAVMFLTSLDSTEVFKATLTSSQVGSGGAPVVSVAVTDINGKPVSQLSYPTGTSATLRFGVPKTGVYAIVIEQGHGKTVLRTEGNPVVVVSSDPKGKKDVRMADFFGGHGQLYFYVPEGTERFALVVVVHTGESIHPTVIAPDGQRYLGQDLYGYRLQREPIEVREGNHGIWQLDLRRAKKLALDDVFVGLEGIPPFFSFSRDALLRVAQ